MNQVYVSIGNSDDKLTQWQWSLFVEEIERLIDSNADEVFGRWLSASASRWQNACWSFHPKDAESLKRLLQDVREFYKQDSIAWAVAETEFL